VSKILPSSAITNGALLVQRDCIAKCLIGECEEPHDFRIKVFEAKEVRSNEPLVTRPLIMIYIYKDKELLMAISIPLDSLKEMLPFTAYLSSCLAKVHSLSPIAFPDEINDIPRLVEDKIGNR
jgi:hypothetical protein